MLCCGGDQLGLGKEFTVRLVDVASTSGRHSRGRGDRLQSHLRTGAGGRWRSLCCSGWFVLRGQLEQFHLPTAVHPGPHLDAEPRPRTYTDGGLLGESDPTRTSATEYEPQQCGATRNNAIQVLPPPPHRSRGITTVPRCATKTSDDWRRACVCAYTKVLDLAPGDGAIKNTLSECARCAAPPPHTHTYTI